VNNPIVLNATTTTKQDCSATDSEALILFRKAINMRSKPWELMLKLLLNCWMDKTGVVAYLRKVLPQSANDECFWKYIYKTISQTAGSTINYAVKLLLPVEECRLLNTFLCSGQ
jgi:hypothetical protein